MTLILKGTDNSVSDPAVQGGTGGATTGVYYPASNQVGIASGGTKAIIVTQSNVTNFYNSNNLRLYTANEGNYGFLRNSGASSSNSIELGANGVVMRVDDSYNATFFNSGAAQKTIITANNGIGIGGATPSSGTGITFPSAQDASSDANTLDDYEEGTWTPVFARDGGSPSITYSVQNGVYTKVGNIVSIECLLVVTGISSQGGSGNITVAGFPFASTKGNSYGRVMLIGYNDVFDDQALTRGWMSSSSMYIMPAGVTQAAYNGTFTTGYFAVAGCYLTD